MQIVVNIFNDEIIIDLPEIQLQQQAVHKLMLVDIDLEIIIQAVRL